MIKLEHLYIALGLVFAAFAILSFGDRANGKRLGNAAFWGLFAASFLAGSHLGDFANGVLVLALVALGGFGALGRGAPKTTTDAEREVRALRRGNALFIPALLIPIIALAGTLTLKRATIEGVLLLDASQVTLISLGFGVAAALIVAMLWLRPPVLAPLQEGRRLIDAIGWTAILPQLLAALGAIFTRTGVGQAVSIVATRYIPLDQPFEAVAVYCLGMAMFTFVMGNAFAAFPVMTAAIGLPLIVHKFGGSPAIMGAIGMLAGFCGTLMTPMAANFNIVPAALLDLSDRNGVIKAQIPTAIPLLLANTILMYALVFRF
ncbi:MAG TPA: DUF979 domain-containing protein [Rhizomicrobium sp.]|nr:DUF979 domain-containing protein [Rhizomicrobium sp.]